MLLKHILSNVNIPTLLDQINIFFKKEHVINIEETIQKFQVLYTFFILKEKC